VVPRSIWFVSSLLAPVEPGDNALVGVPFDCVFSFWGVLSDPSAIVTEFESRQITKKE
jgi:hypothetical protein